MNECKHRWEPSNFGERYWAPGTYQYTCARCNRVLMGTVQNAKDMAEGVPRSESNAAT